MKATVTFIVSIVMFVITSLYVIVMSTLLYNTEIEGMYPIVVIGAFCGYGVSVMAIVLWHEETAARKKY